MGSTPMMTQEQLSSSPRSSSLSPPPSPSRSLSSTPEASSIVSASSVALERLTESGAPTPAQFQTAPPVTIMVNDSNDHLPSRRVPPIGSDRLCLDLCEN